MYYLLRTSHEFTDKIESSEEWISWSNDDILRMLVKRVLTFFEIDDRHLKIDTMDQATLTHYLSLIMAPRFLGRGKWTDIPTHQMLMTLIRKRPRDLIKLCTFAANNAHHAKRNFLECVDFMAIFDRYSDGRLKDLINEFKFEMSDLEKILYSFAPSRKRLSEPEPYFFQNGELLAMLGNQIKVCHVSFTNHKIPIEARNVRNFLYKINFITARKKNITTGKIERFYFEEKDYIAKESADFGFDWEVHPAYRWALQASTNIEKIFESLPSQLTDVK